MEDKQYGINILIVAQLQLNHNYYLLPTNNHLTSYLLNYYIPTYLA
jgi:hypothetical protein